MTVERRDVLVLFLLAMVVAALSVHLIPVLKDDSYIYLRVAANLGQGHGYVYNAGDYSNPTSSPLYTLFLVVIGWAIGYSAWTLAVAFGLSMFALAALQYLAWRRSDSRALGIVMALVATFSTRVIESFGMETTLLLAGVSATALAYRAWGDSLRVGVLCGLTVLARPDGVVLLGLLVIVEAILRRRFAWRTMVATTAVIAPWYLFATAYFGSPVSQSVQVKMQQRHYGGWAEQPDFLVWFLLQPRQELPTLTLGAIGVWLAFRRMFRGDPFMAVCVGLGLLQVVVYQVMQAPVGYVWYFAPGNLSVDLAIVLAVYPVMVWILQRLPATLRTRWGGVLPAGGAAALTLLVLSQGAMMSWKLRDGPYPLLEQYRRAATWMRAHADDGDAVAATEIGYIGWYSKLRVVDIHGLLHREALAPLRAGNLHWWYDSAAPPRFVVVHVPPWPGEPGSAETWPKGLSQRFMREFQEVLGCAELSVFERVGTR